MKMKLVSAMLCVAMSAMVLAGCGGKQDPPASKQEETGNGKDSANTDETDGSKDQEESGGGSGDVKTIKFYGKVIEYTSGPMMTDALEEQFRGIYNIDAIQVDWSNMDKVIRTGIASGDPCDIYNYELQKLMANFSDMAVDLKPYLEEDPEWKGQFRESDIDACTTADGRVLCLPWETNFSVILANKAKLQEIGVEIPEEWTFEEFQTVCQKIQDAGLFPFANASDLNRADWIWRNAMLSEVCTAGIYDAYTRGEVPLNGEESVRALENTKALYDKGYMYPGDGAVTVKSDEVRAAFYQGKVLMMSEIAAGAKSVADEADFEVVAVPWPSSNTQPAILGGMNVLFIPQNCGDIDAAVEVLKAYTSKDIANIHAAQGYIPVNVQVEISDPFAKSVLDQAKALKTPEGPATAEMNEYRANQLMPDLILNGGVEVAAEAMESLRGTE